MTDTLPASSVTAGGDVAGTEPYRPAPPAHGPARWARRLVGVREDLLDWVPEERPRYARLGLIVVNTGLMAALSLATALHRVVDVPWPAIVPAALFWGFLVVTIDSWLISSTHGLLGGRRLALFVPRLVIALLMGAVIAEPLLLWAFQPAIHAQLDRTRNGEVNEIAGRLKQCNPADGSAVDVDACGTFRLPLASPDDEREKLRRATAERNLLRAQVDKSSAELRRRQAFAEKECAGRSGPGLSGTAGKGFRCDNAWKVVEQYRQDSRIVERQARLDQLDAAIAASTNTLAGRTADYAAQVDRAIAARLDEERQIRKPIGVLDEDRALGELSRQSGFVLAAQWLVRLLLITIDCLPVLAKFLGGSTTYDLIVNRQIEAGKRMHHSLLSTHERRTQAASDVAIREIDHDRDTRIQAVDEADRVAQARYDAELDAEIDRLAERYSRDPRDDD
ncbi:DUF4407 domain-containing protein [Micromonospora sp. NPDC051141]|uniref:DUF4407 domain-containing protein n=1 Tax=Micromonospora sp. NPDC051141 TaxID=3364284 RepID=UPI0037AF33EB